jgi:hypothetical protein
LKGDKKKSDKKAAAEPPEGADAYESGASSQGLSAQRDRRASPTPFAIVDGDVAATADDRAFIDTEGDDEELLSEYQKERQNFNDDEVDNEFEAAEERSAKPA